jgi:hypothetical protein
VPHVGVVRVEAVEAAPFQRIICDQTRTFSHKQEYKFKFHRLKANILCNRDCPMMRRYLWHIADNCPNDLFQNSKGARCSDTSLPELGMRLERRRRTVQGLDAGHVAVS